MTGEEARRITEQSMGTAFLLQAIAQSVGEQMDEMQKESLLRLAHDKYQEAIEQMMTNPQGDVLQTVWRDFQMAARCSRPPQYFEC